MASTSPLWVILYKTPRVSAADATRPGGAVSLALATPPRVSRLVVDPSVFPADPDSQAKQVPNLYIKATDPSGIFLAEAKPPKSNDDGISKPLLPHPRRSLRHRLPPPRPRRLQGVQPRRHRRSRRRLHGRRIRDRDNQNLVCFSSETHEWVNKTVATPLLSPKWSIKDGKIWWVDQAHGILACDPFADEPDMAYIPLPTSLLVTKIATTASGR
ncbi:hypothetical protein PR202_gb19056 [Eleusine coracana subsp. coracana]|uniref:DUF1618 domain-containing protein n=1 Tax=Eleusine coracana subsp. coracana TaxID=191504 RepID=A0AAV5F784_ELECO|nr:hypothetical protein PR202_gb19056 [Eleusine coracana subsp. coracana]